ncbi:MAG: phosphate acetyltransferase [candidate division Zixibacteria bacterium SM23_73_2]|nr:MAG: phosphate acetyltransferase [candidate division Zixibacteria bacterium SM23_73_2]
MDIISEIREKAKKRKKRVVLPEGEEERMVKAAKIIMEDRIAEVTLLGDEKNIEKLALENGLDLNKIKVKSPENSSEFEEYAQEYFKIREKKGMTIERAKEFMKNSLFFGAMMVRKGEVDCSVAGSINTTGDVLRAALHIIGLAPGIKAVSSSFLIVVPEFLGQKDKVFVFGDCAVIPDPDPEQLASIAVSSARTMKSLVGEEPKVAMLSFSTKGSARHQLVDKVIQGTRIAKEMSPEIEIDGELQFDAAVIPEVARKKSPGSRVAGQANVLIFPDLNSGNIGYKLAQRLSGASAIGPIIQGLAKPANDLSRGCSVDDIVNVTAVASLLA